MKRTVILLGILTLLVFMTLNRWNINVYSNGKVHLRADKLTTQIHYSVFDKDGYRSGVWGNKYLVHGTTALLYSAMAATTIALLLEAKRKDGD